MLPESGRQEHGCTGAQRIADVHVISSPISTSVTPELVCALGSSTRACSCPALSVKPSGIFRIPKSGNRCHRLSVVQGPHQCCAQQELARSLSTMIRSGCQRRKRPCGGKFSTGAPRTAQMIAVAEARAATRTPPGSVYHFGRQVGAEQASRHAGSACCQSESGMVF